MTDRTLKGKLDRLATLQQEIDTLTDQADELKDQIKAEMNNRAVDELEAGSYIVRWRPVVSSRFDSKAFKADHAKLYQQYAKPTESRRFTLVSA